MIRMRAATFLGGAVPPSDVQRALALIAALTLFIGTRSAWTEALTTSPMAMFAISIGYLTIMVTAALALMMRTVRALVIVEALILAAACVMLIGTTAIHHTPSDEGTLVAHAARTLMSGGEIYGVPWPQVFADQHIPITKTMDGGADYTLGYPPMAVLLNIPGAVAFGFPAGASITGAIALLIGTIGLWVLLPIGWRSGATAVMLGFPFLSDYARLGYPAVIAMVFLIPVVVRWPTIAAGDRLSRSDILKGICLGAACATQQLAWFVTPFLLVGLYALRRGDGPTRRALRQVGSFTAIAAITWLAINLPFIARNAPAWAEGVLLVLTQHAIPHGQGLIDVSFYLTGGSGALDFYSYATLLLGAGLLVASMLWVRWLGPALTVIPWLVFYLSIRSQDGYFLLMTPLWLAAAATAPPSAFASAWQPSIRRFVPRGLSASRGGRFLFGPAGRIALAGLLLVPALACATIAVASDKPLEMEVVSLQAHGPRDQGLWRMDVKVGNRSAVPLTPHFTISHDQSITPFWSATGGPTVLAPHQSATYELTAPVAKGYNPGLNDFFFLRALTDRPMTVSSTRIPIQ